MERTIGLDVSALDPAFKAHAQRGIGRYVTELCRFFERHAAAPQDASLAPANQIQVATFDHRTLESHGGGMTRLGARLVRYSPILRTTLKQQLLFPSQLAHATGKRFNSQTHVPLDAIHFPAHMDAPAWGLKGYALTVLDLIPIVCAHLYPPSHAGLRFRFARWLELTAIRNASIILCISAHTARDVHQLLGVPWERLVVTPLGVDERFFVSADRLPQSHAVLEAMRTRLGIPPHDTRPLVLYVGGIDPRKNAQGLLQSFAEVVAHFTSHDATRVPRLVMAGRIQTEREYPTLLALIRSLGLEPHVTLPGFVSDEDLRTLYAASAVFFFPSLYEGFGLPPLEAMAAGVPVVSSDASAMPEVLGEAALLYSPSDPSQGARALIEVLSNPSLAMKLREQGPERARLFTWDKTGYATLHGYERLLQELEMREAV